MGRVSHLKNLCENDRTTYPVDLPATPASGRYRFTVLSGCFAALMLLTSCAMLDPIPDPVSDRADMIFQRWIDPEAPGAAVAIVRDGEAIFLGGYGMANLEYNAPITSSTLFHIASISKQFTAYSILLLEQQEKLSLDDDIRTYLPYLPDFGYTITIRHLLHHTSGLRDQWELLLLAGWRLDDVITQEHIVRMISRQQELNFEPGSRFMYSNTGYTLLAEIVANITRESFSSWTYSNIFAPLEMTSTRFLDTHDDVIPGRAYSYERGFSGGYRHSVLNYANVGATSLITTAEDMSKWLIHFETGVLGGMSLIEKMLETGEKSQHEDGEPHYAYALFHDDYRGLQRVYHSGSDAAFNSFMSYYPSEKVGIVVMSNSTSFSSAWMAHFLTELYLSEKLEPIPEQRPHSSSPEPPEMFTYSPMSDYSGRFFSEELDTYYHIESEESFLRVEYRRKEDMLLIPSGTDQFTAIYHTYLGRLPDEYLQFRFRRDEQGDVSGFEIDSHRILNLAFTRVE